MAATALCRLGNALILAKAWTGPRQDRSGSWPWVVCALFAILIVFWAFDWLLRLRKSDRSELHFSPYEGPGVW
jgi:hypothetical protein